MKSEETIDTNKHSWGEIIRFVWDFLDNNRKKYIFWIIVITAAFFYNLVPTFIVGLIVDFFIKYKPGDSLQTFYTYVIFLSVSYTLVSFARLISKAELGKLAIHTVYRMRVDGFERLMDFSIKWHEKENSGNKVQKIQTGTFAVRDILNHVHTHKGILQTGISLIGVLMIFIFLSPIFLIFFIAYLTIFFAIEYYYYKRIYAINMQYNIANERSSGSYYEGTSNVLTVKTLGIKDSMKKNISINELGTKDKSELLFVLGNHKWRVFQTLNGIYFIIFFLLIGHEILASSLTAGFIMVYYTYYNTLRQSADDTTELIGKFTELKTQVVRMIPLFDDEDKKDEGTEDFPAKWDSIKISKGNFHYQSKSVDDFALADVNIEIKQNEKIGIVGKSGSGKSTLAKLLLGVYDLESGEFKIGDVNYYDIEHSQVSHNISTVLQETELFNLSLADNIRLMREVDGELFKKAIEIAQLEELIKTLPEGLNTLIGEKGYRLSGGERQRVGIARAICKDPQILVLDEATSALDSRTEQLIQNALEEQMSGKTLIIIAHRLSTLKNVDRIIVFNEGRIVEQGKFSELLQDQSTIFSEMYSRQH